MPLPPYGINSNHLGIWLLPGISLPSTDLRVASIQLLGLVKSTYISEYGMDAPSFHKYQVSRLQYKCSAVIIIL